MYDPEHLPKKFILYWYLKYDLCYFKSKIHNDFLWLSANFADQCNDYSMTQKN